MPVLQPLCIAASLEMGCDEGLEATAQPRPGSCMGAPCSPQQSVKVKPDLEISWGCSLVATRSRGEQWDVQNLGSRRITLALAESSLSDSTVP